MLQKLQNHININFPHLKGKKLLLATSGGIDSMVLVHLFHQLKFQIAIAHCNFNLRGSESDADEEFVWLSEDKARARASLHIEDLADELKIEIEKSDYYPFGTPEEFLETCHRFGWAPT